MLVGYITREDNESGFGSGKTLLMTSRLWRKHLAGAHVRTNYGLTWQDAELIPEDLDNQNAELQNMALGIDEIQVWLDSRASATNRRTTYFILQSRKRDVHIHWTSQDWMQVDKRVRRNTDFLVECWNIKQHLFGYRVIKPRSGRLVAKFALDGRKFYDLFNTRQIVKTYERTPTTAVPA